MLSGFGAKIAFNVGGAISSKRIYRERGHIMKATKNRTSKGFNEAHKTHVLNLERICDNCPTTSTCAPLKCALVILDGLKSAHLTPELAEEILMFKQEVNDTGYLYPKGDMTCNLVDDEVYASELVRRASELLKKARTIKVEHRMDLL